MKKTIKKFLFMIYAFVSICVLVSPLVSLFAVAGEAIPVWVVIVSFISAFIVAASQEEFFKYFEENK